MADYWTHSRGGNSSAVMQVCAAWFDWFSDDSEPIGVSMLFIIVPLFWPAILAVVTFVGIGGAPYWITCWIKSHKNRKAPHMTQPSEPSEHPMNQNEQAELPPNPFYRREYVYSLPDTQGIRISIPCPGGKWPPPEEIDDMIAFFELIIKQMRRGQAKSITAASAATEGK